MAQERCNSVGHLLHETICSFYIAGSFHFSHACDGHDRHLFRGYSLGVLWVRGDSQAMRVRDDGLQCEP